MKPAAPCEGSKVAMPVARNRLMLSQVMGVVMRLGMRKSGLGIHYSLLTSPSLGDISTTLSRTALSPVSTDLAYSKFLVPLWSGHMTTMTFTLPPGGWGFRAVTAHCLI